MKTETGFNNYLESTFYFTRSFIFVTEQIFFLIFFENILNNAIHPPHKKNVHTR